MDRGPWSKWCLLRHDGETDLDLPGQVGVGLGGWGEFSHEEWQSESEGKKIERPSLGNQETHSKRQVKVKG